MNLPTVVDLELRAERERLARLPNSKIGGKGWEFESGRIFGAMEALSWVLGDRPERPSQPVTRKDETQW